MKKIILILLIVFTFNTLLKAQDIIVFKDGTEIESKVLKVGKTEIVYKKNSNLNGPEYTEEINNIFMIKYEGGGKDIFNNSKTNKQESTKKNDIILRAGTNIQIYLGNKISSKSLRNGDIIPFYVKQNVRSYDGQIIISANTYVECRVTNAEKAEVGGVQGELDLMVNSITAVDGSSIPVFLSLNNEGEDKADEAIGVGLFLFWPALFMKGGEAEMEAGKIVLVQTTQEMRFNANELISGSKNNQNTNTIISNEDENIIYNEIIDKQNENPCGEKPKEPINTFNEYKFHLSKEYKSYQRALVKWKECMQE